MGDVTTFGFYIVLTLSIGDVIFPNKDNLTPEDEFGKKKKKFKILLFNCFI